MKKLPAKLTLFAITSVFAACGKEYTCFCKRYNPGSVEALVYEEKKLTKKRAEKWCKSYNTPPSAYGKIECELK